MQMPRSLAGTWLTGGRPYPVVVVSPHPPAECLRRLSQVTTRKSAVGWYASPRTAGHPEPRLRGEASDWQVQVTRFTAHSGGPWLIARPAPSPAGGTVLTGTIGQTPAAHRFIPVFTSCFMLLALGVIAGFTAAAAAGQDTGPAPVLLIPAALIALAAFGNIMTSRMLDQGIPGLARDLSEILGAAPCRG